MLVGGGGVAHVVAGTNARTPNNSAPPARRVTPRINNHALDGAFAPTVIARKKTSRKLNVGGRQSIASQATLSRWSAYQVATAFLTREIQVNPDRERFFGRVLEGRVLPRVPFTICLSAGAGPSVRAGGGGGVARGSMRRAPRSTGGDHGTVGLAGMIRRGGRDNVCARSSEVKAS